MEDLKIPNSTTTPDPEAEIAAILEGLTKVRAAGPAALRAKMVSREVVPLDCRLTRDQWASLRLSQHAASLFCGRAVSQTLVVRRALMMYADHVAALLRAADARAQAAEGGAIKACR